MSVYFCKSVDSDDSDGNEINNPNKEENKGKKLSWWKKKKSSKTEEEEGRTVKDGKGVREAVQEMLNMLHPLPLGAVPVEVEAGASGRVSWNVKPQKLLGHQGADAWSIG